MFINDDIPRKKLGWYTVNGVNYTNKYHALENCKDGHWPEWNFHDDIFSEQDWSREPNEDLYEIYRQRAQQLRDMYDHVILYYSGGIDSHAVLRTFLDNDIKIDGIIISGSYSIDSRITSSCNLEQKIVAMPYLNELKKQNRLNVPIFQLDTVKHHHFEDENWVYSCGQSLTPQVYSYNFFWQEPWIKNFLEKGSTCFVRGVDKPRIIFEDNQWFVSFIDVHILSGTPTGILSKKQNWDIQEYFFWTPDMPKIVVKQAHIMINWLERNLSLQKIRQLTTKENTFNRKEYNLYADPLVYGAYVDQRPGLDKPYFSLNKPVFNNMWHKDIWFLQAKDVHEKEYQKWIAGLRHISDKIDPMYFNKAPTISDDVYKQHYFTEELINLSNILHGTVGSWSKFHKIKDYLG